MSKYKQMTEEERYEIAAMRKLGMGRNEIGRKLDRDGSTISRELRRNAYPTDKAYRPKHAQSMTNGRRRRSRQGTTFTAGQLVRVEQLLRRDFSPEQISGHLRRHKEFSISHETIYQHVLTDRRAGGSLYKLLRCKGKKQRRKRYGAYDSRGRLAGKRPLSERPPGAKNRSRTGHWEIDTVHGSGLASILTIVDRKTGFLLIGKLAGRTVAETNRALGLLIDLHPSRFHTITADNGCEFHGYAQIEEAYGVDFYFAQPYHSWERGTNENTNGLIRQYLPKGCSMENLTQAGCNMIARKLNRRPRKRHDYRTPAELFLQ